LNPDLQKSLAVKKWLMTAVFTSWRFRGE